MSPFVHSNTESSLLYTGYAIIRHSGSASSGHYTSVIRENATKWILFNDTVTSILRTTSLLVSDFLVNNDVAHACVFFYVRKDWNGWNRNYDTNEPTTKSEISESLAITDAKTQVLGSESVAHGAFGFLHRDFIHAVPSGQQQLVVGVAPDGTCGRHAILVGTGKISIQTIRKRTESDNSQRRKLIHDLSNEMRSLLDSWTVGQWITAIPLQIRAQYWCKMDDGLVTESTSFDAFKTRLFPVDTYLDYSLFYIASIVRKYSFIVLRICPHEKYGWNKRSVLRPDEKVCVIRHLPGPNGAGHYEPIVNATNVDGYDADNVFI